MKQSVYAKTKVITRTAAKQSNAFWLVLSSAVLLVAFTAWLLPANATVVSDGADLLQPTDLQRTISAQTRRYVGRYHYQPAPIDDKLSTQIFDDYLESLDPSRAYFTQSDIEYFSRNQSKLDDFLRRDDAAPAFEIFNIYRQRVTERSDYAKQLLDQGFDFSIDESLEIDREDAAWPATDAELNDYWRKRVKNDWLRLLLTDKEPDEIRETLGKRYSELDRRIHEMNGNDIFQLYMNAYLTTVEPHTSYLSPRASEDFEIAMRLSFEGIGALLGSEGEYTIIREIVPGGPAELDGRLQPDDRIVGVGQDDNEVVNVVGWRVNDVVDLIRGPKDSTVVLEVLPGETGLQGSSVAIDIVRNEIQLEEQAAQSEIIEVPDIDVDGQLTTIKLGVIDLPTFYIDHGGYLQNKIDYRSSTRDVRTLIQELKRQDVSGIIVDLRNNGGGSLLEAQTLTGLFIDEGPVVQVRDSSKKVEIHRDNEPGKVWNGPLAVLVNRYSASASEIFAAALQDYGRALVIGENTFGKGTVQNLIDLNGRTTPAPDQRRGQLKLTMAQFFRVNGGSTQNRGVIPDIILPTAGDADDYGESSLDNALPWTRIQPAKYTRESGYQSILPQLQASFVKRIADDPEFQYLRDDIKEYEENLERKSISLLEATRREEMQEAEERRIMRRELRSQMLSGVVRYPVSDHGRLNQLEEAKAEAERVVAADEDEESDSEEEADAEEPDVYLEEAARVLAEAGLLQATGRRLASRADLVRVGSHAHLSMETPAMVSDDDGS